MIIEICHFYLIKITSAVILYVIIANVIIVVMMIHIIFIVDTPLLMYGVHHKHCALFTC